VVDEAGQIGGKQMLELIRLVCERNARLVLSGDTRQHGAVEASDALLPLNGIRCPPVELHKIRRQDPALAGIKRNMRPSGSIARRSNWRRQVNWLNRMNNWRR